MTLLQGDEVLAATIESLQITEDHDSDDFVDDHHSDSTDLDVVIENTNKKSIKVYLYKYPDDTITSDTSVNKPRSFDLSDDPDTVSTSSLYTLETFPTSTYTTLWESLQFDSTVKSSILAYITAIFKFSLLGLTRQDEISFNRILLLHGPPGTGNAQNYYNHLF